MCRPKPGSTLGARYANRLQALPWGRPPGLDRWWWGAGPRTRRVRRTAGVRHVHCRSSLAVRRAVSTHSAPGWDEGRPPCHLAHPRSDRWAEYRRNCDGDWRSRERWVLSHRSAAPCSSAGSTETVSLAGALAQRLESRGRRERRRRWIPHHQGVVRERQHRARCDPDSTAILTAKLTAKRTKNGRSRGYQADVDELPAVQKRTVEHHGKGGFR